MTKKPDTFEDKEEWGRFERAVDAAVKCGPRHRSQPAIGQFDEVLVISEDIQAVMDSNSNALAFITKKAFC